MINAKARQTLSTTRRNRIVEDSLGDTTELYVDLGGAFHSNDAHGTVFTTDPKIGDAVDEVT